MTRISHANRGQALEDMIEATNEQYLHQGKALVQKIPEPVNQISKMDRKGYFKAHYAKKSIVDYLGTYRGYSLAFDAKETSIKTRLDLGNIKDHQYTYLASHTANGGISFLVVWFKEQDEMYYLPFQLLDQYWQGKFQGGRKSIPYQEIAKKKYQIQSQGLVLVDYLSVVERVISNG
ncbi:Holliday junction resolvase RecU [Sporohalobacter salinus]|uniref:Holliday junction resolvase RecU n=1 Tax=Sporohalobacter salinus TaxID=1494606 RepID=UPI00195FDC7E|nr:Holliday junction resolvase RecU [Sporohalobacter salinus]MBM7623733.1 recombination protein U [Sporohalobacter salinus]